MGLSASWFSLSAIVFPAFGSVGGFEGAVPHDQAKSVAFLIDGRNRVAAGSENHLLLLRLPSPLCGIMQRSTSKSPISMLFHRYYCISVAGHRRLLARPVHSTRRPTGSGTLIRNGQPVPFLAVLSMRRGRYRDRIGSSSSRPVLFAALTWTAWMIMIDCTGAREEMTR